jgi:hypothetical protein
MIDLIVFAECYVLRNSSNGKEISYKKETHTMQEVCNTKEFIEKMMNEEYEKGVDSMRPLPSGGRDAA